MVFGDDDWEVEQFDAERDIPLAAERIGPTFDAVDPDLGPLAESGGKLLIYHGWADPGITPHATVEYYESVMETMGPSASDSVRLFMVPGMGHCGGGEGPGSFDQVGEIDQWVTSGRPPDRIIASRTRGGEVDRTRPLCPFPRIAVYDGSGSTDLAENFTCRLP
jgi:feruloyl esterase